MEEKFVAALAKAAKNYEDYRKKEKAKFKPLTADQLSSKTKEFMCLDVFPEDIQNDILALSEKIANYILDVAKQPEEKRPPLVTRFINCWGDTPSRRILRDATKVGLQTLAPSLRARTSGVPSSILKKLGYPLAIGTFGASLLGGWAGHMAGCMSRAPPKSFPPRKFGMRPRR